MECNIGLVSIPRSTKSILEPLRIVKSNLGRSNLLFKLVCGRYNYEVTRNSSLSDSVNLSEALSYLKETYSEVVPLLYVLRGLSVFVGCFIINSPELSFLASCILRTRSTSPDIDYTAPHSFILPPHCWSFHERVGHERRIPIFHDPVPGGPSASVPRRTFLERALDAVAVGFNTTQETRAERETSPPSS